MENREQLRTQLDLAHTLDVQTVLQVVDTSLETGLSTREAQQRLNQYGPNQLREVKPPSFLASILNQLRSILILILVAAVLLSVWMGQWVEASVILAIILLNALVGALQERRAEQALQRLREMAPPEALVLRDGTLHTMPAKDLVPGDVVQLDAGAIVPADLRLLETSRLQIDESSLTGESLAVSKSATAEIADDAAVADRTNLAYSNSVVSYGRGIGVVVATGQQTQIGQLATLLEQPEKAPPLQRKLEAFGRLMGAAVLGICALLFLVGLVRSPEIHILFDQGLVAFWEAGRSTILGLLIVAVSLAVAAVPEGLPAVVTMTLAIGTQRMLRRNTLVRKLPSVESLGSATIICTDKTGTLTQNQMTVCEIYTLGKSYTVSGTGLDLSGQFCEPSGTAVIPQELPVLQKTLLAGAACNDARLLDEDGVQLQGDPTEGALLVVAAKGGLDAFAALDRAAEIPFDSERKRMTTIHRAEVVPDTGTKSPYVAIVKGAVDGMLPLCSHHESEDGPGTFDEAMQRQVQEANQAFGLRGLRVLALAYRPLDAVDAEPTAADVEQNLVFLGLAAMQDPPRDEVIEAIATARTAGLRTVMITGDHATTAEAIATQIGLKREHARVVAGEELESWSEKELQAEIERVDVFARVSPHHKVRIVEALQASGHIVAMTGDGVNDAPALKQADVGIAMGITGTDVAKATADMVLVDDNYASIVAAVEQGRIIYANIRKSIFYLLTCNFAEIAILFTATLLGWPPPLTAIQLLWLNLVTDGAPALALSLEKGEQDVMSRPPRPPSAPIIDRKMLRGFLVQSTALAGAVLGAFGLGLRNALPELAGSIAFATLVLAELVRAHSVRSDEVPFVRLGWRTNLPLQIAILASVALMLAVLYIPPLAHLFEIEFIPLHAWRIVLPFALIPMLATETRKLLWMALRKRKT